MTTIGQNIEILCNEYGLDRTLVIEAMKEAVKAAAKRQFKSLDKSGDNIEVDWNDEEGMVEVSAHKKIVEMVENSASELSLDEAQNLTGDNELEVGDELLIPLPTEELGRIAAQTAKQVLVQKVREAVRSKVYDEYFERIGEIFNGQVKRFERGDMVVELSNNLESVLPKKEQVRSENWSINDRIRIVIKEVSKEPKGHQIVVSRASAELLKRLFEMEVPEIYDGTVVIKSAVREPGDRAKIAVSSNEKDVDPVGACVGMKGSRVQSIIKELRGEKIDIIEWSDEPSIFAANALSPAKVSQVRITDIDQRKMEVIVPEDQLSLAIGKFGQNVRLATKLIGWNIDIVSEEVLKTEIARRMSDMMAAGEAVPLTELQVVTANQAETLDEKGIGDVESLAAASVDDLVDILDISLDEAERILSSARAVVDSKNEQPSPAEVPDEAVDMPFQEIGTNAETVTEDQTFAAEDLKEEDSAPVVESAESSTESPEVTGTTEENASVAEFNEEAKTEETSVSEVSAETVEPPAEIEEEQVVSVIDEPVSGVSEDADESAVFNEPEMEVSNLTDTTSELLAEQSTGDVSGYINDEEETKEENKNRDDSE